QAKEGVLDRLVGDLDSHIDEDTAPGAFEDFGMILRPFEALSPRRVEDLERKAAAPGLRRDARLLLELLVQLRHADHVLSSPADGDLDGEGAVGMGRREELRSVRIALTDSQASVDLADAELHAVVRLLEHDELGDALEEREQDGGRQALETQGEQLLRPHLGVVRVGGGWVGRLPGLAKLRDDLPVGPHVHVGPSRDGGRAKQEPCNDVAGVASRPGPQTAERAQAPLEGSHDTLRDVELLGDGGSMRLVVRLLARPDLAHGDRAIHEAVGPRAVQVEEADGFRREQARVRNEVFERYSDEEAKVSEKG